MIFHWFFYHMCVNGSWRIYEMHLVSLRKSCVTDVVTYQFPQLIQMRYLSLLRQHQPHYQLWELVERVVCCPRLCVILYFFMSSYVCVY
jgi:hypothetical protein